MALFQAKGTTILPTMSRFVTVVVSLAAGIAGLSGCTKSSLRSGEGIFCSTSKSDNPFYGCQRGIDIVCLSTHRRQILKDAGATTTEYRELYACRVPCSQENPGCFTAGDVCCPGKSWVNGKFDKAWGCVPPELCEAMTSAATDAGRDTAPPERPTTDAGMVSVRDAMTPDMGAGDFRDGGVAETPAGDLPGRDAPEDVAANLTADVAPDALVDVPADAASADL